MPKGKAPIAGTVYIRPKLSYAINTRLLRRAKKQKHPSLTKDQVAHYRVVICDEVASYIGGTRCNKFLTVTERTQELDKFILAIKNLLDGIDSKNFKKIDNWSSKSKKYFRQLSKDSKSRLYASFDAPREDAMRLWRVLDTSFLKLDQSVDVTLFRRIAKSTGKDLEYLTGPNLVNPPLLYLVSNLAPIWVKTTGRSLKTTGTDANDITFAKWLRTMLSAEDITLPQEQSINDILKII